jgi:hypothetical protein
VYLDTLHYPGSLIYLEDPSSFRSLIYSLLGEQYPTSTTGGFETFWLDRTQSPDHIMEASPIDGDGPPGQPPEEKKWSDEELALIHAAMMVETESQISLNIEDANTRNRKSLELAARTRSLSMIKASILASVSQSSRKLETIPMTRPPDGEVSLFLHFFHFYL